MTKTDASSYVFWALLSAIFAGMTALLGKKGIEGVPSNLAVAVRVAVVLVFSVGIAIATKQTGVTSLSSKTLVFLTLSGIATGASWLCYFRALQMGPISAVAPIDKLSFVLAMILGMIFLKERPSGTTLAGAGLIVAGRSPHPEKMMLKSLFIVMLCIFAAIGYGIVHDKITAHLCVEYFTIGHPPDFGTDNPALLGLGWGILATW